MPERSHLFEGCRFDESDGRLTGQEAGRTVTLRPQAARLLVAFLERPGEVLNRDHLCAAVWDEGTVVDFESGLAALMRELRQALDEIGAGARLIETVPRRGYRFLGTVRRENSDSDEGKPSAAATKSIRSSRLALLALVVLVLGSLAALFWWLSSEPASVAPENPTLAIMPFEVYSEDGPERRLRLLVADRLLARLWEVELADLDLIGRAALKPYENRNDQASAVAADLGVSLLIEGSIIRPAEDRWQIDARLLAMPRGTVLWSRTVQWEEQGELPVMPSVNELVADLAEAWPGIRTELGPASD